jgi:hypothetical protein
VDDRPSGPGQVVGEVVQGEVDQLDTGGPDQRRPGRPDRFGELAAPTGQDERQ